MKVDCLPIGLYEENSYVLHDKDHVLFIDPGRYAERIAKCVSPKETVDGIILTHGHEDHTAAADDLADLFGCDVYMSFEDSYLTDPKHNLRGGYGAPVYHEIKDLRGTMEIGSFKVEVIATPGHTSGSVCVRYRSVLFTGDTLFCGSIGRTDLYSGNEEEMIDSLRLLAKLPGDLKIYPGHGPDSTIAQEKMFNPYLAYLG